MEAGSEEERLKAQLLAQQTAGRIEKLLKRLERIADRKTTANPHALLGTKELEGLLQLVVISVVEPGLRQRLLAALFGCIARTSGAEAGDYLKLLVLASISVSGADTIVRKPEGVDGGDGGVGVLILGPGAGSVYSLKSLSELYAKLVPNATIVTHVYSALHAKHECDGTNGLAVAPEFESISRSVDARVWAPLRGCSKLLVRTAATCHVSSHF
mgnify:CR=1 FL=1|jgi:hypothetical protein